MAAPNTPNPQAGGAPAPKKTSPWIFVLIGCAGLIVFAGLAAMLGGYFIFHKAKEAGLDADLVKEKPGLAMAKIMASINPDVEVVSVDEDNGKITIRDKKTGKTVTVDMDDVKNGHISIQSEDGETATMDVTGKGDNGTVKITSSQGTWEAGENMKLDLPGWVPIYPGGTTQGLVKQTRPNGSTQTFMIKTNDSVDNVIKFYSSKLKAAGFEVTTIQNPGAGGGMVTAEQSATQRAINVMVGVEDGQTQAAVSVSQGQ